MINVKIYGTGVEEKDYVDMCIGDIDDIVTVHRKLLNLLSEQILADTRQHLREEVEHDLIEEYFGDTEYGSFQELRADLDDTKEELEKQTELFEVCQHTIETAMSDMNCIIRDLEEAV